MHDLRYFILSIFKFKINCIQVKFRTFLANQPHRNKQIENIKVLEIFQLFDAF